MRLTVVVLVLAVGVGVSQAQFSLGPNGFRPPPINLLNAYKYMRNVWSSMTGNSVPAEDDSVKVATGAAPGKIQAREGLDYDTDLVSLKERIQQASSSAVAPAAESNYPRKIPGRQRGTKISTGKVDPDAALTRAILLPKKKVALGKWPIVYGVLNSILLAAAIILAKPYFYEGETVVSAYSNEYGYGHPHHIQPGYGYPGSYSDEHKGKYYKGKGSKGKGSKGKGYSKYPQAYPGSLPHPFAHKGKGKGKGKGSPPPQAYAIVPAPRGPSPSGHYGSSHSQQPVVVQGPQLTNMYSSHMLVLDPNDQRHNIPSSFEHRSNEYNHRSQELDHTRGKGEVPEAPFSELHYYNPTVFTASESSSYACMEHMICMNPSRSARARVISTMKSNSGEDKDSANWENMIRRLDDAAAIGERREDCAQFYCPPQLPNHFETQTGVDYAPPPPYQPRQPFTSGQFVQGFPEQQFGREHSSSYETVQRLKPVSFRHEEFSPEPVTLQQLNNLPFTEGVVDTGSFVPPVGSLQDGNIYRLDSSSIEREDFIRSTDLVKRKSQPEVLYIQAPKISTSEYAKVTVQNQNTDSSLVAEQGKDPRNNRGVVKPVTLADLVQNEKILAQKSNSNRDKSVN